jgi:hypothetical protein
MSDRTRIEDVVCDLFEPLLRQVEVMIDRKFSVYLGRRRPPVAASQPPGEEGARLLTRRKVATMLDCHPRTVTRKIKEGKLRTTGDRGQWITQAEFDRFMSAGGGEGGEEVEAVVARLMKK